MAIVIPDRFETARLTAHHWLPDLTDPGRRTALEQVLATILTPAVLQHLPPPLHLGAENNAIANWITARASKADVMLITPTGSNTPIGLMLHALNAEQCTMYIGYLFAQTAWGQGYATELVSGLIATLHQHPKLRLIGGVSRDNPASARVLKKVGFTASAALSTPDVDMYTRTIAPQA
ncbi:Protein N-acetyltransferase, RimJ/RimL family [Monaibacterium marinum]|uniref:Protein N-acetyltransferase, RimJ/RimL family n=1 Tax=Pontivivens marinum TaxID=1690039 RepID=A0A2C9CQ10_9RHOB|nr:GNAT family N-acetyltransferase [Monaibacterium marinum]SOH93303.1 Protein N-acetyltransferase, RimJ/RimL family [Monaibacterium marinum]